MENCASAVTKVVIMGAAGRDFHNFNVVVRNNPRYRIIAFTAVQIPNIAGLTHPSRGMKAIKRSLLGSASEKVLVHARGSVLLVR